MHFHLQLPRIMFQNAPLLLASPVNWIMEIRQHFHFWACSFPWKTVSLCSWCSILVLLLVQPHFVIQTRSVSHPRPSPSIFLSPTIHLASILLSIQRQKDVRVWERKSASAWVCIGESFGKCGGSNTQKSTLHRRFSTRSKRLPEVGEHAHLHCFASRVLKLTAECFGGLFCMPWLCLSWAGRPRGRPWLANAEPRWKRKRAHSSVLTGFRHDGIVVIRVEEVIIVWICLSY